MIAMLLILRMDHLPSDWVTHEQSEERICLHRDDDDRILGVDYPPELIERRVFVEDLPIQDEFA